MDNIIQKFSNTEFGTLEVMMIDGVPYLPAKECALFLGYKDAVSAIKQHCRGVVKRHLPHPQSPGKTIEKNFIPEGDLYRLISRSKLPSFEQFERWVFDEVLPSIRKHGAYMTPEKIQEALMNPDGLVSLLTVLKGEQDKRIEAERDKKLLEEKLDEAKPKVAFYNAVVDSKGAIAMNEVAKILDMGIGRNNLFAFLRDKGVLMSNNLPYQNQIEAGRFRVVEKPFYKPNGEIDVRCKTLVYQRGLDYIYKLCCSEGFRKGAARDAG